jgi:hypothetical protein
VVVPDGVLVVCHLAKDPRGSGFGSYFPSGPLFPSRRDRFPLGPRGWLVFFLTPLMGKCHNSGIILSILTLVLCHLLTLCLSIDAGRWLREHVAHGFRLLAPHGRKQQMVL